MPTILVVDDRPVNRDYLVALLGGCGYTTIEAIDGQDALEQVRRSRPDLVIADILMPTMDGYEFVRQLRSESDIAHTAVIFLSAHYRESEARSLAESCGVYHIITKPVEPEVILTTVSRALGLPPPRIPQQRAIDQFTSNHLRLLTDTLAKKANELESTNRRLSSLIQLGQQLAAERDPNRLLSDFCHSAADILGADYALVAVRDQNGGGLRHVIATGVDPATVGRITAPRIVEALLEMGQPEARTLLINDTKSPAWAGKLPPEIVALDSVLVAPILSSAHNYGSLCLGGIIGAERSNGSEQRLAASMAAVIAVNYENALRYEEIQGHAARLEREAAQRKRAQDEVLQLNVELEHRVAERTSELEQSHQRLRETERMAAIGTLSAGLGHDMGNLLLPIRSHLDVLDVKLPEDLKQHLHAIRNCMNYLQSLTNGLRLLALDPDDEKATAAATDLHSWRAEVMPLLKSTLPREIKLSCEVADSMPPARVAPHRLTQAVLNLVNNSADALRKRGTGSVRVTAVCLPQRQAVCISVSDDGEGMTDEIRKRALEPFFTTKKRGISTGLGLSLVNGIVEAAGGKLEIDSTPQRGTTISLIVPVAADALPRDLGTHTHVKPVAALTLSDERLKALVSTILESMGFEVSHDGMPEQSEALLWLTEPDAGALRTARNFLAQGVDRRIAVFGEDCDEWIQLGAVHLGDGRRPSDLRDKLRQVAGT